MANNSKKYISLARLSDFLDNIKAKYSQIGHKHTINDLTDYKVDTSLSPTSNNPIANSAVDAEFDAISDALGALELSIDGKLNASDYVVDSELTSSSTNPIANKAVNDGINLVYETMFSITDEKADINHTHTKEEIGLENVDNTADAEKSVNYATTAGFANSVEWKNVSDKPFSTQINGTVVLSATNVEESDDGNGIGRGSTGRFSAAVVSGEEYKVVFDGAEYYCTAYTDSIMNDYIILGNFAVIEPITGTTNRVDTGEPFLICYSIIYKYAGVYTATIDSHTVEITHIEGVVESIDESCIPDSIARIEDIPSIDGLATETFATNAASEKLIEAKAYTDTVASGKADSNHNHDSAYDIKGAAADSLASAKEYADTKIANLASTTVVDNKITSHNTSTSAHSDIRDLITGLTTRLNTLANSDDATLDQMSEVVAYIKNNKSLIDGITTSKINVSDIVNNLTTNSSSKVLSAAQGVAIKSLIDALQEELDGHTDDTTKHITSAERTNWNAAATAAAAAQTRADNAYTLAEGKVDSLSDLGITATATELNYMDGVTSNVQTQLDTKADTIHIHPYGVCSSSATYTTKTVTVDNFSLVEGARVIVKFTNANSASSPKLNVNGTGAIPIMRYGTTAVGSNSATNGWEAGAVLAFTYDGTNWVQDYWYNTTYTNIELGQGFGYCYTSSSVADKEVTMSNYEAKTGGIVSVKFSYSVDAGEITMNINGKGAKTVNYMGSDMIDDVIKGGDIATFIYTGSTYHLISVDRWFEDIAELQANDSRVRQMPTTTNGNFRLLLTPSFQSEEATAYTYFNSNLYANPYYNKIYADISGTSTGVKGVTAGNFLVGNGSDKMTEKTPAEVLSMINGASVRSMTTAEYNALGANEINANTLYMLTDGEQEVSTQVQIITWGADD